MSSAERYCLIQCFPASLTPFATSNVGSGYSVNDRSYRFGYSGYNVPHSDYTWVFLGRYLWYGRHGVHASPVVCGFEP